jgi:uncharacterized protein involved in outer membrane biogenesis
MAAESRPGVMEQVAAQPAALGDVGERVAGSPRWWRWTKWIALLLVCVLVVDLAASLLVQRERVRKRLNARMEAAFGRPVEVDRYSFGLWGGPTLEANGVRVGEDPRFGHEYFLRADSIEMRLRWLSLLRGRFELETLSLTGPTVNVVQNAAGDWNLAEWLGHPAAPTANRVGPMRVPFVPRFRTIDVDGGRVNFKRGDEKLAFAFVNVAGSIFGGGAGRWRLDLEATPWRVAELLQQPGTIHLAGSVGGTSSALRPASLQMSWTDVSLSDFLRLMSGDDSGVRGTLAIGANAQTSGDGWAIEGQAQLAGLHRWDLTIRPDSPALNLAARMRLDVPASMLDINEVSVDGAHSNARGWGRISWAAPAPTSASMSRSASASATKAVASPVAPPVALPVALTVESAAIDLGDLVAWLRAFRTNIPSAITISGFAHARATLSGWPVRVTEVTAESNGAALAGAGLNAPVRVGALQVAYARGQLQMQPATITIGGAQNTAPGSFRVEIPPPPKRASPASLATTTAGLHLTGAAGDTGDVIAVANAFGWNVARGWQLSGPIHCDLHWPELEWPWKSRPEGTVTIGGDGDDAALLHAPFLNLPVSGLAVRMDWKPGVSHVMLTAAQAFGARWSGTFDRSDRSPEWQFALAAGRLNTADLDRWLDPQWRESFIDRVLPFLNSGTPSKAVPEDLRGTGRLSVDEFSAAPFILQNLAGDLTISGRDIAFDNASGELAGGQVDGSLEAKLGATPSYQVSANFSGLDLGTLTGRPQARVPAQDVAAAIFGGTASGNAEFSMKGAERGDLAASLDCKGALDVRGATWHGVALTDSLQTGKFIPGDSAFGEASGQFACANGAVALQNVALTTDSSEIDALGSIDFARRLDLQMRIASSAPDVVGPVQFVPNAANTVRVTGTLAEPEFSRVAAGRRSR